MSISDAVKAREVDVTVELLEAIGDAFNRHDVDAILGFFADDGIFDNAKGADIHGARYAGKTEIRNVFTQLFETVPDLQWLPIDNRVCGDKGISEWRRQCTLPSGEKQDWNGLDIFTFRDGQITRKDTYFKIVD